MDLAENGSVDRICTHAEKDTSIIPSVSTKRDGYAIPRGTTTKQACTIAADHTKTENGIVLPSVSNKSG